MNKENNGDWGLGIGGWGWGPIPHPQSPIPHTPFPTKKFLNLFLLNYIKKYL